jgi:hypothetical protein
VLFCTVMWLWCYGFPNQVCAMPGWESFKSGKKWSMLWPYMRSMLSTAGELPGPTFEYTSSRIS